MPLIMSIKGHARGHHCYQIITGMENSKRTYNTLQNNLNLELTVISCLFPESYIKVLSHFTSFNYIQFSSSINIFEALSIRKISSVPVLPWKSTVPVLCTNLVHECTKTNAFRILKRLSESCYLTPTITLV